MEIIEGPIKQKLSKHSLMFSHRLPTFNHQISKMYSTLSKLCGLWGSLIPYHKTSPWRKIFCLRLANCRQITEAFPDTPFFFSFPKKSPKPSSCYFPHGERIRYHNLKNKRKLSPQRPMCYHRVWLCRLLPTG